MNHAQADRMSCTLNSACDCVHVLCSMVEVVGNRYGLDAKQINRMVLAVDELFANIGRHGYHGEEGIVEMHVAYDGRALSFEFRDYAEPIRDERVLRLGDGFRGGFPGGLGMRLIHAAMDEFTHRPLRDGNRWVLVKYVRRRDGVEA